MHDFFRPRDAVFDIPSRAYALLIDGAGSEFVLFDAVNADYFDRTYAVSGPLPQPGSWRNHVDGAPIYAIEINASDAGGEWLAKYPHDALPEWSQIELVPDDKGEAAVYNSIAGPPRRARISVRPASNKLARMLALATDLAPDVRPEDEIELALPASPIEHIFALDVGQGSANALVAAAGKVVAYVDLGAGVLADVGTWPPSMRGICLLHDPPVILTHWHYDHFHAANIYPAAQGMTWIAALQTLGPGPQSAMASAIGTTGKLMVWSGGGILSAGKVDLERCVGPATNQNRSGMAVWVRGEPVSTRFCCPETQVIVTFQRFAQPRQLPAPSPLTTAAMHRVRLRRSRARAPRASRSPTAITTATRIRWQSRSRVSQTQTGKLAPPRPVSMRGAPRFATRSWAGPKVSATFA
ncbi:hypothetical protein NKI25_26515 [Mesorhizobium sp. M0808]|uniref:hypothetical protein n=1 Tax=unclassified Mesorhizobium TaxID=325217 RepID=UPI003339280B